MEGWLTVISTAMIQRVILILELLIDCVCKILTIFYSQKPEFPYQARPADDQPPI